MDGYAYGLNWGMVGVGSDNARGSFDNVRVQVLPPQVTFDDSDDFSGTDTLEYFDGATSESGQVKTIDGRTVPVALYDVVAAVSSSPEASLPTPLAARPSPPPTTDCFGTP